MHVASEEMEEAPVWQKFANCLGIDPDLFFPSAGASTRQAKEVCRSCEVRNDCLEYALATRKKNGIWGGYTAGERLLIRLRRWYRPRKAAKN